MCLAVPGKIVTIDNSNEDLKMGKVDFSGIIKDVCFDLVPEVNVGDYVVVHVGFALIVLNEEEALKNIDLINEIMSY
ncbi:MAG: hydrogenase assembly protein HupF [Ignavibacteria bacterium GWB2_35_12]|nr:MAG: hydrogenase assembly protein HupF [Ignavibacteria bacterium GWA2_35_8]OGU39657.1 MAG: hydrogenase assembly protein HupF [Ignavibacteria bacterium GWB2_35_12]OGU93582.1 MAG: hydrogenase assembly protein HupF [Ignavibacteria bacterium RIFOXYA2_FULL_35_10]OGV23851.1 MAG: hydrogenase assembly protein HupF [Ignavibacteria bacterium RIFOXYC2_FULL_35_21]